MRSVSDESPAASPMRAVSLADDGDLLLVVKGAASVKTWTRR